MWRWRFVTWPPWPQPSQTRSFMAGWTPISVTSCINCSTRKSWDGNRVTGPWRQPRQPLGIGPGLWSLTILRITCLEVRRRFQRESLYFRQEPWMTTTVPLKKQHFKNLFKFFRMTSHPLWRYCKDSILISNTKYYIILPLRSYNNKSRDLKRWSIAVDVYSSFREVALNIFFFKY